MACCGRANPVPPIIRPGLPTIWSWITPSDALVAVPHERLDEVLARVAPRGE